MDHLPEVVDPFEPIYIPYLGGELYDGLDFAGYPARQNWQIDLLVGEDRQGRTSLEAAQFLQTWLYFGMLYEALRINEDDCMDLETFVRIDSDSHYKFITTRRLPELMRNWHRRIKNIHDYREYYNRFRDCMRLGCGVWRDLMEKSTDENNVRLLSHEILLSIQILGAALDIGITEICGSRADYTWRVVPRSQWLMQRMIRQGWCPTVLEQLSRPCATFLYYCSLLGPQRHGDDHSKCSTSGRACLATNIGKDKEYVAKHVVEGCHCQPIVIPTGDGSPIANAIIHGGVPVIHLRYDGTELDVDIQAHTASKPIGYTAISHV